MEQITLTKAADGWCYLVTVDGRPTHSDCGYETAMDALLDATECPTPVE